MRVDGVEGGGARGSEEIEGFEKAEEGDDCKRGRSKVSRG